jgi:anaerobic selenocysteine-containing dehydrogenase
MIYSSAGDLFNQCPNAGKIAASLDKVEFIVAQDHFLTPTARLADIVLPATTFWERNDVHVPWSGAGHYAIYMRQAIETMYECRNDIDIFDDLSRRVGINGYNDKSERQWLQDLTSDAINHFVAFVEQGTQGRRRFRLADTGRHKIRNAIRQNRDLFDSTGGQSQSLWVRHHPANPDMVRPCRRHRPVSTESVHAKKSSADT